MADKLLMQASTMPHLDPAEDKTITTLYVGGLGDTITETDLKNHFYQFGEIQTITVVQKQQCASSSLPQGMLQKWLPRSPLISWLLMAAGST